jgi:hypothetical protein
MIRANFILLRIVPLAAAIAGGLSGCSNERTAQPSAPETVRSVSVIPVQRAVCRTESVSVWIHQLVPDDDLPA